MPPSSNGGERLVKIAGVVRRRTFCQRGWSRDVRGSNAQRAIQNQGADQMPSSLASSSSGVPLTEAPAWEALGAHYEKLRSAHLRNLFADDPQRGEPMAPRARDCTSITRSTASPRKPSGCCSRSRTIGTARANRCDVSRRQDQRDGKARGPARCAARAARRRRSSSMAKTWCLKCISPRPDGGLFRPHSQRRAGRGTPASASATSSISASADPTSAR